MGSTLPYLTQQFWGGEAKTLFVIQANFLFWKGLRIQDMIRRQRDRKKPVGRAPIPWVWGTDRLPHPGRPAEASAEEGQQHVEQRPLGTGVQGSPSRTSGFLPHHPSHPSLSMHMEVPKSFVIRLYHLNQGFAIYGHRLNPAMACLSIKLYGKTVTSLSFWVDYG